MSPERRELSAGAVRRLTLDPGPWLSCDACFHLVDSYVEQALSGNTPPIPGMHEHLAGCPACSEEAVSLLLLVAQDRGIDPAPALRSLASDHAGPTQGAVHQPGRHGPPPGEGQ